MGVSGADADALDRVGVQLERAGQSLRRKGQRLRSSLHAAPWRGRSADRFRSEFDSVHARAIADAARFLDDAYETLARNAREQREASGSGGPSWQHRLRTWWDRHPGGWPGRFPWFGPGLPGPWLPRIPLQRFPFPRGIFPWFDGRVVPMPSPIRPPVDLGPLLLPVLIGLGVAGWGRSGPSAPAPAPRGRSATPPPQAPPPPDPRRWGRTISAAEAQAVADANIPAKERPAYGKDGEWYQCTAWAKARWREMGYKGDWNGHGKDVAGNINRSLGRPNATQPTPGAIVSFSATKYNSYGHVAVVEEVRTLPDGRIQFRVSEMNMGDGNPNVSSPMDSAEAGLPQEFKDTRWVDLGPGQVFAPFPK